MKIARAGIIWAMESAELHHDLPVYMQKIGGISILAHIINNLNQKSILQKIVIVMHEACYDAYQAQLTKELINLDETISFEIVSEYETFFDFFTNIIETIYCHELFIMNANLPFIEQKLVSDIFSILNEPINKSEGYLPAVVMPEYVDTKINNLLDDLEKSLNFKYDDNIKSFKLTCSAKCICIHYGFVQDALPILHELITERLSNNAENYIDFINNEYLSELISYIKQNNLHIAHLKIAEKDLFSVKNKEDLMVAELIFQEKIRKKMLTNGVHMIDASTVFFSANVSIAKNVTIHPHVVFGCNVIIEEGVTIKSYSHLEQTFVAKKSVIGPFANIYDNVKIGRHNHIGNFVDIRSAIIGENNQVSNFSNLNKIVVSDNNTLQTTNTVSNTADNFSLINNNCNVGQCTIYPEVHIDSNSNILDGSIIDKNIPKNSISYTKFKQYNRKKKIAKTKITEVEEV